MPGRRLARAAARPPRRRRRRRRGAADRWPTAPSRRGRLSRLRSGAVVTRPRPRRRTGAAREQGAVRPDGGARRAPRGARIDVGGFDEALHVGEDVDLAWRLDAAGRRIRYEPAVRSATHPSRPSWAGWLRQRFRYGTAAADLAERHGDAVAPVARLGVERGGVGRSSPSGTRSPGAAVAAGTTAALTPKLRGLEHPARRGGADRRSGQPLRRARRRRRPPAAVVALRPAAGGGAWPRSRPALLAAALVPAVLEWRQERPALDPVTFVALRLARRRRLRRRRPRRVRPARGRRGPCGRRSPGRSAAERRRPATDRGLATLVATFDMGENSLKTRAAILWESGTDWSVEDIELDDPKAGEVKVKLAASGLCHSDEHLVTGDMVLDPEIAAMMGLEQFPSSAATRAPARSSRSARASPASPSATTSSSASSPPAAGARRAPAAASTCATSAPSSSPAARSPTSPPATTPRTASDLGIMCCTGTFSPVHGRERGDLHQDRAAHPARQGRRSSAAASPPAGAAATYAADVQTGETVVVIGIGGVGMNAVQGAAMAGARHVVAVDPVEWKRDSAAHLRRHPHRGVASRRRRRSSARSPGAPTPTRRSSPPAWSPAT